MKKIIAWIRSIFRSNKDLIEMINAQQEAITLLKMDVRYTTLKIPDPEQINAKLSELYYDNTFTFIIHAMENEVMERIKTGDNAEYCRGKLIALGTIRSDMYRAAMAKHKKDSTNGKV